MNQTASLPPAEDKRRFHRVLHDAACELATEGQQWVGQVVDISLKGCLIRVPDAFPRCSDDVDYRATIHLNAETAIHMTTRLAHRNGDCFGFRCLHIDLESISTLRRLVELNLGEASLLERDIAALAYSQDAA